VSALGEGYREVDVGEGYRVVDVSGEECREVDASSEGVPLEEFPTVSMRG